MLLFNFLALGPEKEGSACDLVIATPATRMRGVIPYRDRQQAPVSDVDEPLSPGLLQVLLCPNVPSQSLDAIIFVFLKRLELLI